MAAENRALPSLPIPGLTPDKLGNYLSLSGLCAYSREAGRACDLHGVERLRISLAGLQHSGKCLMHSATSHQNANGLPMNVAGQTRKRRAQKPSPEWP